ncbi:MAG: DUF5591 domain-containing protein [Thermoplasmata archaeon]|nr:DUF5591 domain-containing protein [Thermoplasmata archaeon]
MRFEVIARDSNSRIMRIEYKGKEIETPALLWCSSPRIPAPKFAKLKLGKDIKSGGSFFYPEKGDLPPSLIYPYFFPSGFHDLMAEFNEKSAGNFGIISAKSKPMKKFFIYIMANSMELFSNPRNFVKAVIEIRKNIGYKPLYAPGIALPHNLAILSYSGIDLFDSLKLVIETRRGKYFTPEGSYDLDKIDEYPCSCRYCKKGIKNYEDLLMHNYEVMKNEIIKVREAIKNGKLRELAESKAIMHPEYASILRIFDNEHYEWQEKMFPVTGNKINVSCLSFNMPAIKRFRERILYRYKKPESAKILLLLPCSSKKPYSASKSHSFFKRIINGISNKNAIHEVILTSPLGIVPRELENFYPAAHYNISVTGYWNEEEKSILQGMIDNFLKKNRYDVIISHLPKEMDFLSIDAIQTCRHHPTSEDDLKKLENELKIADEYEYIHASWRRRDNANAMLLFQFGKVAENLLDGCIVKGKFPNYRIYCNGKQVASYVVSRGMFALTFVGGLRIGKNYWVEIDDFYPKGSVFAVGVKDADDRIRNGDEVVVFYEDEMRGVGTAKMNGDEMIKSEHGEAVKIRHYK